MLPSSPPTQPFPLQPPPPLKAYERASVHLCAPEVRMLLFLELEMRFVRLDMLWQSLAELVK
jgi:hypothetical protein